MRFLQAPWYLAEGGYYQGEITYRRIAYCVTRQTPSRPGEGTAPGPSSSYSGPERIAPRPLADPDSPPWLARRAYSAPDRHTVSTNPDGVRYRPASPLQRDSTHAMRRGRHIEVEYTWGTNRLPGTNCKR